jgi:hypothetical protein
MDQGSEKSGRQSYVVDLAGSGRGTVMGSVGVQRQRAGSIGRRRRRTADTVEGKGKEAG